MTTSKLPSCSIRRESTTSTQRGSHDTATSLIAFGKEHDDLGHDRPVGIEPMAEAGDPLLGAAHVQNRRRDRRSDCTTRVGDRPLLGQWWRDRHRLALALRGLEEVGLGSAAFDRAALAAGGAGSARGLRRVPGRRSRAVPFVPPVPMDDPPPVNRTSSTISAYLEPDLVAPVGFVLAVLDHLEPGRGRRS
jgi:hypothetical protein